MIGYDRFSRVLFTPFLVRVLFWTEVSGCVIAGLVMLFSGLSTPYTGAARAFLGLGVLVFGPAVARFWYEVLMTVLRLEPTVDEIEERVTGVRRTNKWERRPSRPG